MKAGLSPAEMASQAGEVAKAPEDTVAIPARLMIVCTLVQGEYSVGELEERSTYTSRIFRST